MPLRILNGANGRITARVNTLTAAANVYTPVVDTTDIALITSPAAAFTLAAHDGLDLLLTTSGDVAVS